MTPDARTPESSEPLAAPVRLLAMAVLVEAALMVVFIGAVLVSATRSENGNWGAASFVLVVLGLWSAGLVVVSRGVLAGRRWAFTPILFTQGLFGAAGISFFGAAAPVARMVCGLIVIGAVVVLRLLFSREVREHLIYANS